MPSDRRHSNPLAHRLVRLVMVVGLSGAVLSACSDDTDPSPGPSQTPVAVTALAGDAQTALVGVPARDSLVVQVRGDNGPLRDIRVDWTALGGGEVRPTSSLTDAHGRAMALWVPSGAGADSVRANVAALSRLFRGEGRLAESTTRWFGREDYIEYRAGTLPLVISAPHGGTLDPTEIPDRTAGILVRDTNTDRLAFAIADALEARTGERPHLVVSHLHRRKLDPNREIVEAAAGNPRAEQAWHEFQALIEHAQARIEESRGGGLYIDLHGHGHPIARLELGYLLSAGDLARSDVELDQGPWAAESSIRTLAAEAGVSFSAILRGPESLGSLLEARGYPATPSDVQPDPGNDPYFTGGYNTARHGSRAGGPVSGVQIETHYPGVRDSEAARAAFAAALADALAVYLARWY